jgi:hypothetical protein
MPYEYDRAIASAPHLLNKLVRMIAIHQPMKLRAHKDFKDHRQGVQKGDPHPENQERYEVPGPREEAPAKHEGNSEVEKLHSAQAQCIVQSQAWELKFPNGQGIAVQERGHDWSQEKGYKKDFTAPTERFVRERFRGEEKAAGDRTQRCDLSAPEANERELEPDTHWEHESDTDDREDRPLACASLRKDIEGQESPEDQCEIGDRAYVVQCRYAASNPLFELNGEQRFSRISCHRPFESHT